MDRMNVAVIGVGYWGKKIVSEYASMSKTDPNVNLVGVCDVFEDNLKFCKEKYDVDRKSVV
jgi:predicted dehydrogenase